MPVLNLPANSLHFTQKNKDVNTYPHKLFGFDLHKIVNERVTKKTKFSSSLLVKFVIFASPTTENVCRFDQ